MIIKIAVRHEYRSEITPKRITKGKSVGNEEWGAAAQAVDRDLKTEAVTSTEDGAGWIKLEFDITLFVDTVVIHYWFYTNWFNPERWCVQSEANFRACVDKDSNVDVSVYQGEVEQKSCGTLHLTYGLEQSDQIYTLVCNAKGDSVKLSKDTGNLAVFEIAIIKQGKYHT